jgi:hypothetical protein
VLYARITQSNQTPKKWGKLRDEAYSGGGTMQIHRTDLSTNYNATTNPYLWESKIEVLRCPSYPGEESVTQRNGIFMDQSIPGTGSTHGVGNYLCLPSTHYIDGGDLATAPPRSGQAAQAATDGCNNKAYCGNGALPFPGIVGTTPTTQRITRQGYSFAQLSDGTSKTVMITESREEAYTAWYSGFASYGVGAWPRNEPPEGITVATGSNTPVTWTFAGTDGEASLNKGDRTENVTVGNEKWYMMASKHPHKGGSAGSDPLGARKWGPSSLHPGVVQHGWGDGRGSAVNDTIDGDVYLHLITRNGRETSTVER